MPHIRDLEREILPGARYIGISVVNFKSIAELNKLKTKCVDSFFKKVNSKNQNELSKFKETKNK